MVLYFHVQLDELEEEKQRLERCLSSARVSCEQLTAELGVSRQETHFWESQYLGREHLVSALPPVLFVIIVVMLL